MIITGFNKFFDRHGRWAYLLLGLIISLSFVFFVTPRGCSPSQDRLRGMSRTIGSMYGVSIPREEFLRRMKETDVAFLLTRGQYLSQQRGGKEELPKETLRRMRVLHEARERKLADVSDEQLKEYYRKHPFFQKKGAFDKDSFKNVLENIVREQRIARSDIDRIVRDMIIVRRLEAELMSGVFVSEQELRDEFNRTNEEFVIDYAAYKADVKKHGEPTDEEVAEYFKAHQSELRLLDQKRVRVAIFPPTQFNSKVTLTEADLKTAYEGQKTTTYKDKTFEQVKKRIEGAVRRHKASKLAEQAGKDLAEKLADTPENEDSAARAERFSKLCAEAGVTPVDSEAFTSEKSDGKIPGVGTFRNLMSKAYAMTKDNPSTGMVSDMGRFLVATLLETIPGEQPKELTEWLENKIRETILETETRTMYAEKIAVHAEALAGKATAWEYGKDFDAQLKAMPTLSDEQKEQKREEFGSTLQHYISPFFIPEQKKVKYVAFRASSYRVNQGGKITEASLREYYASHDELYQKEELRGRQILVRIPPGANDKAKMARKAVIEQALREVGLGKSFEEVATRLSEDLATRSKGGDLGFLSKDSRRKEKLFSALSSMEVGEVSAIIENPASFLVLKLEEKRVGRPFAEVQMEIRGKVLDERCTTAAKAAADRFVSKLYEAREQASKAGNEEVASALFSRVVKELSLKEIETDFFRERGRVPGVNDYQFGSEAFQLDEKLPLSGMIKGSRDCYAACWIDTKSGHLPTPEEDPTLLGKIKNRVKMERAIGVARAEAEVAYKNMAAKLEKDEADFVTASEGVKFERSDPFPRERPPYKIPDIYRIIKAFDTVKSGDFLPLSETDQGAVLIHIVSRELPKDVTFAEKKAEVERSVNYRKRYAALNAFNKRLREESNTLLAEEWAGILDEG
ncbi:MAG: peptidyl-prolyl cis-trans isomerase [Lentisphaeria bacterium]|nr:peptidyl-prolyl cis-trans isomerase [Lentisphaeria bacterium]